MINEFLGGCSTIKASTLGLNVSGLGEIDAGRWRAAAGPGKPLSRGPVTTSFLYAEIETHDASRGRKAGEGCPLTIRLWVWEAS